MCDGGDNKNDDGVDDSENVQREGESQMGVSMIDNDFYKSSKINKMGGFSLEDVCDNNDTEMIKKMPLQKSYNLRDNNFRLKGITKNKNMSILYEQDEKKVD
jgi:hypothetical protein